MSSQNLQPQRQPDRTISLQRLQKTCLIETSMILIGESSQSYAPAQVSSERASFCSMSHHNHTHQLRPYREERPSERWLSAIPTCPRPVRRAPVCPMERRDHAIRGEHQSDPWSVAIIRKSASQQPASQPRRYEMHRPLTVCTSRRVLRAACETALQALEADGTSVLTRAKRFFRTAVAMSPETDYKGKDWESCGSDADLLVIKHPSSLLIIRTCTSTFVKHRNHTSQTASCSTQSCRCLFTRCPKPLGLPALDQSCQTWIREHPSESWSIAIIPATSQPASQLIGSLLPLLIQTLSKLARTSNTKPILPDAGYE
ncbi:hypothetical protein M8818_001417 [Zalaria obscura]|uniref:Uncharacterized protein n=1 Tax=Zalaria obscura TaxID=2024903 RepID=A0ACC3SKD5_9PEZI